MKNILLTTAHKPSESCWSMDEKITPVGVLTIASILREAGHNVFFKDPYTDPSDDYNDEFLESNSIDVVGIYFTTACKENVIRQLQHLKVRHPNVLRLVGGPGTSFLNYYKDREQFQWLAHHIVIGEADNQICDIVKKKSEVVFEDFIIDCGVTDDLESLPMPAYDLLDINKYDYISISTSRGCPRACTFCCNMTIGGRKYRMISAQKIVNTIVYLQDVYDLKQVYFRENNFCISKKRTLEFCKLIKDNGIAINWRCEGSPKDLDFEVLFAMKEAGCNGIYIGFESGSQRVLDELKPGFTVEQNEVIASKCNQVGIPVYGSFIGGSPWETPEDLQLTLDFIKRHEFVTNWINVFILMPGAPLYDNIPYVYENEYGVRFTDKYNCYADRFYKNGVKFRVPEEIESPQDKDLIKGKLESLGYL